MKKLHRILSALIVIFICVPLYIIYNTFGCLLEIVNNFTYENYNNFIFPFDILEKNNVPIKYYGFFKVWLLLVLPIIEFFRNTIKGIKSIEL